MYYLQYTLDVRTCVRCTYRKDTCPFLSHTLVLGGYLVPRLLSDIYVSGPEKSLGARLLVPDSEKSENSLTPILVPDSEKSLVPRHMFLLLTSFLQ